jgi:maltose O-acetyltransferase
MWNIISVIKEYRHRKYMEGLIKRGFKIGKNSHILEGAFLDPSHCFLISIGDNCTFAPNVKLIAHDASLFKTIGISRVGRIKIGSDCFLGDSVIVLPGVSIGPRAIVGAGSVVTRDIPENSVAAGNPARVLCSLDELIAKHKNRMTQVRVFKEDQFSITRITEERKKEMLDYLDKQVGYMSY